MEKARINIDCEWRVSCVVPNYRLPLDRAGGLCRPVGRSLGEFTYIGACGYRGVLGYGDSIMADILFRPFVFGRFF